MTGRLMLCSGTGGPPSAKEQALTCPVCGKQDPRWAEPSYGKWPPLDGAVPRHYVQVQP
jgi:hypothetical protein